ncbi:PREDICTED: uncharacterized protein LOC105560584 isoform X2 [Vollenhovia emeryi]|uniref:uncharacterized protein LOC105560584 isoform X2 n=1 Tax=Vollenhovia emeryi TaxID=411798 RepID=UPI0005F496EC|nr:PREDICTED: uncharacterized protein LOC105560584 isoform X2 [Vollenhovia emeryi]
MTQKINETRCIATSKPSFSSVPQPLMGLPFSINVYSLSDVSNNTEDMKTLDTDNETFDGNNGMDDDNEKEILNDAEVNTQPIVVEDIDSYMFVLQKVLFI